MTNEQELVILKAILKEREETIFKKALVFKSNPDLASDLSNQEIEKIFKGDEEFLFCDDISYQEWDKLSYDMEIRMSDIYVKFRRK